MVSIAQPATAQGTSVEPSSSNHDDISSRNIRTQIQHLFEQEQSSNMTWSRRCSLWLFIPIYVDLSKVMVAWSSAWEVKEIDDNWLLGWYGSHTWFPNDLCSQTGDKLLLNFCIFPQAPSSWYTYAKPDCFLPKDTVLVPLSFSLLYLWHRHCT